jgi:hypothetical protein
MKHRSPKRSPALELVSYPLVSPLEPESDFHFELNIGRVREPSDFRSYFSANCG